MNGEIEQSRWTTYLDEFSRRNSMRPARLQIIGEETGAQEEAQHMPLVGVSFERKGSEAGAVEITLGGQTAADPRHLTHTINSARRIAPKIGDDGREDALEIEAADGTRTIIIFERLPLLEATTS